MIIADPRELCHLSQDLRKEIVGLSAGLGAGWSRITEKWPPVQCQGARVPGGPAITNPSWLMEGPSLDRKAERGSWKGLRGSRW